MSYTVHKYNEYSSTLDVFGWLFGAAVDGHEIEYTLSLHNAYTFNAAHTSIDILSTDVTSGGKSLPALLQARDYLSTQIKMPHSITDNGEDLVWQWEEDSFTFDTAILRANCSTLAGLDDKLLFAFVRHAPLTIVDETLTIKPFMLDIDGVGLVASVQTVVVDTPAANYSVPDIYKYTKANMSQFYSAYPLWAQFSTGRLISNPSSWTAYYYSSLRLGATRIHTVELENIEVVTTATSVGITADTAVHPAITAEIDTCEIGIYWPGFSTYLPLVVRDFPTHLTPENKAVRITFPDGYIFKWDFEPAV